MYRIGLSTKGKEINESLFKAYSDAGIVAMEISPDGDKYDLLDYEAMCKWSQQYGVELWSFHLPFYPFDRADISSNVSEIRVRTVSYLSELICKAGEIGIKKFIVHPSGEPILDEERKQRLDFAKDCLSKLADVAEKFDAVICVEDLPRTCLGNNSDEIKYLTDDDDRLRLCFDTNHLLKENAFDYLRRLGDKIVTLHVSDYDFVDEKHWMPGEGKIDWKMMLSVLKEINYDGVWMYEIPFACPPTILRERDLCCDDFVKNAHKIFAMACKKIICIGDSLTEGDYGVFGKCGIANVQEKNYPYFLAQLTGANVVNYGKCGYTSSSYLEYYKSGEVDVSNTDIIIIMLGTNGGQSANLNDFVQGNSDYEELVRLVERNAPSAKIFLCTPPHVTENPEMSNCGYAEQVKEAVGFVRLFAEKHGYDLIDVACCPDFTADSESVMQPNDGLHFGEEGYRRLARYIEKGLRNL